MSTELHKYIENAIDKKDNLYNAEVLDFPKNKKIEDPKNLKSKINDYWNINDKINDDQLKAVTGICFMFGILVLIGLFANLTSF